MLGESPKKIVIVEDEWIVAQDLKNSLIKLGYEVCAIASYGMEALESVKINSPDLILMDIKIKGEMDGIETAEKIKSTFNLPVIFLTGKPNEDFLQRAKKTEPCGYLVKPYNFSDLHATIEIALYKSELDKKITEIEKTQKKNGKGEHQLIETPKFQQWLEKRNNELKTINAILKTETEQRKLAQDSLRNGQKYLQNVFSSMEDIVFVVFDREGIINFLWGSEKFEKNHGINFTDFLGNSVRNVCQKPYNEEILKIIKEIIETGKTIKRQWNFSFNNGNYLFDLKFSPIIDEAGEISSVFSVVSDITETFNGELEKVSWQLKERVKELELLHRISHIFENFDSMDEIIQNVVTILPGAWQYPSLTCAEIIIDKRSFKTKIFQKTHWKQTTVISSSKNLVGSVNIFYIDGKSEFDEDPFLPEEKSLINNIAERLGNIYTQKLFEKTLTTDRDLLKLTFQSMGDGVITTDSIGKITDMNHVAELLTEWSKEKAIGKFLPEIFYIVNEQTRETCENPVEKILKTGLIVGLANHTILISKTGKEYFLSDSGAPIKDKLGNIIGTVLIFRDDTVQRRSAEKIVKLAKYPEENANPVLKVSQKGEILYNNSASKFLMDFWKKKLHDVLPDPEMKLVAKVLNSGETLVVESNIMGKMISLAFTPLTKMHEVNIYGLNISDRVKAEKILRESEKKYRDLIELLNEGIWTIDTNSNTTFVNQRMADILQYSREEMLGKNLFFFMDEKEVKVTKKYLKRRQRGIKEQHEFEFLRKDGSKCYALMETSPILNEDGIYVGALAGVLDITDRKLAQKELEKTRDELELRVKERTIDLEVINEKLQEEIKEKGVLLQEINHRVKNNIQIIASLLKIQSDRIDNPKYIDLFKDSENRVNSIAIAHEKLYQSENLADLNLESYFKSLALNLYQSYNVDPKKIDLVVNIEDDVTLNVDLAIPCGLILNELVSNSIKHAFQKIKISSGKKIEIILKQRDDNMVTLIVKDNGLGLPKNFDINKSKTLGLQLIKNLTEHQLDGKLIYTRKKGTEFQIIFKKK